MKQGQVGIYDIWKGLSLISPGQKTGVYQKAHDLATKTRDHGLHLLWNVCKGFSGNY